MILYVDTSSLVKRYVLEAGSDIVNAAISEAEITGMSAIGQVETAAAFSKTVRVGVLEEEKALAAWRLFQIDWREMVQIQVTKFVIARCLKTFCASSTGNPTCLTISRLLMIAKPCLAAIF